MILIFNQKNYYKCQFLVNFGDLQKMIFFKFLTFTRFSKTLNVIIQLQNHPVIGDSETS